MAQVKLRGIADYHLPDGTRRRVRLYMAWRNIISRTRGQHTDGTGSKRWNGLTVGWQSFTEFRAWALAAGYRRGMVLDRINPKLGYTPDNCHWITATENANRARLQHKASCRCWFCKLKRKGEKS